MDFQTVMVHLELNADNSGILEVAASLAERCKAGVIGIAACQPIQILADEGCTAGAVIADDKVKIGREIQAIEDQFRTVLGGRAAWLEWRACIP